jgi:hypothetical protein
MERKWKRTPEVIDLSAEYDVVGALNNSKFPEISLLQDLSLSSGPSPAPEITIAPMLVAPALPSAIAPPQPPSPTQPCGQQTPRKIGPHTPLHEYETTIFRGTEFDCAPGRNPGHLNVRVDNYATDKITK